MRIRLLKGLLLALTVATVVLLSRGAWQLRREAASRPGAPNRLTAVHPPASDKSQAANEHQMKVLEKALEKFPGHAPVLFQMAQLESQQGRYREAERHLRELLRSEAGNTGARLELGRVLFQLGDVHGAITQTEEILKSHPSDPEALYNLGAIYGNLGNDQRAAEYWRKLVASAPQTQSAKMAQLAMNRLQMSTN